MPAKSWNAVQTNSICFLLQNVSFNEEGKKWADKKWESSSGSGRWKTNYAKTEAAQKMPTKKVQQKKLRKQMSCQLYSGFNWIFENCSFF